MGNMAVLGLRIVIAVLGAGSLAVQTVLIPLLVADMKGIDPEYAHLRTAVPVILFLGIVTVQVVLVAVWRLVTMVRQGTVFSHGAFRYVHLVIGAMVAAAGVVFALGVALAPGEAVAPGIVLMLGGVVLALLGVALIVLVLRMLLAQAVARDVEATRMQDELAAVI